MKIKWKVDPPPTGRYRSFERRSWPMAEYETGETAARVTCADEYVPRCVRTGQHAELELWIADYSAPDVTWKWRRLTKRAATLAEGKRILLDVITQHPEIQPDHSRR